MGAVPIDEAFDPANIADLIARAKRLARDYRKRTGRPLGVTGEIAEYEAARLLGLRLTPVRFPGCDAVKCGPGTTCRLQIKSRVVLPGSNPGQRLGEISLKHGWEAVLLVVLDEKMEAVRIHRASRAAVCRALTAPGSKARNERGQLGLSKFKSISRIVWERATPASVKLRRSR